MQFIPVMAKLQCPLVSPDPSEIIHADNTKKMCLGNVTKETCLMTVVAINILVLLSSKAYDIL